MSFILTNRGLEKQSAAIRDNLPFTFKHMVLGNGTRVPSGGETSLENLLLTKPLTSVEATEGVPGSTDFRSFIPSTDGPNAFSEVGLLDDDGDLVAIGRLDPSIVIADPGDRVDNYDVTVTLLHSNSNNLVIRVDNPTGFVPNGRVINTQDGVGGGGDLAEDRTFKLAVQDLTESTGASVSDTDENRDWFVYHDSSDGDHKKLSPSETSKALGVQTSINTTLDNLPGGMVRNIRHADNVDEPTEEEWEEPDDKSIAIVVNEASDVYALWEYQTDAWVRVSPDLDLQGFTFRKSNANTDVSDMEELWLDAGSGQLTATLPANPSEGDKIRVATFGGSDGAMISRNGKTIDGGTEDLTLAENKMAEFTYVGANWEVEITSLSLGGSSGGSGSIVAFWAGYLDNGSAISSSGLSWNEYSLGQATFDLDAVQTDDWVIINYRPQANQVISVPAGETDFQVYTSTSDDQGLVLAIKA